MSIPLPLRRNLCRGSNQRGVLPSIGEPGGLRGVRGASRCQGGFAVSGGLRGVRGASRCQGLRGVKLCFLFSVDEADTGFQAENKRQSLTFWTETGPHLVMASMRRPGMSWSCARKSKSNTLGPCLSCP